VELGHKMQKLQAGKLFYKRIVFAECAQILLYFQRVVQVVFAKQVHGAAVGLYEVENTVEEGAFAYTVFAQQAVALPLLYRKVERAQHMFVAIRFGKSLYLDAHIFPLAKYSNITIS